MGRPAGQLQRRGRKAAHHAGRHFQPHLHAGRAVRRAAVRARAPGRPLTYQGSQLLPYAERMVELQGRMLGAVGQSGNLSGVLRIGVIETVVHTWLPDLLTRFAERYGFVAQIALLPP